MTVGELIEYLREFDKNMPVVITDSDYPSKPLDKDDLVVLDGILLF